MPPLTMPALLDRIDIGGAVVVPSARAAAGVRAAHDARQRGRGLAAWEAARVWSWAQWAQGLWGELVLAGVEQRLLLNAAQELALWREIVAEPVGGAAEAAAGLAAPDALAQMARDAWQLAARYNATERLRAAANTHDTRVFAAWAEVFTRRCASRGYLSAALLDAALRQHAESSALAVPGELWLAGFGELTPSQELLLGALRAGGTAIAEHTLEAAAGQEVVRASVVAATERDELILAARQVREILRQRPGGRIAVLVPDLAAERAEIDGVFREELTPELLAVEADLSSAPWEIADGPAVGSLGLVADVLELARWVLGPLPVRRVSALLLSPYLGDAAGRNASAVFDASLLREERLLRPEIGIAALARLDGAAAVPWLRGVQSYVQSEELSRPRTYADWMAFVRGLAAAGQWPGSRPLNATEFAATTALDGVLDLVCTLDFSGRRVTFAAALEALERQARTTVFAPPSASAQIDQPIGAQIQVMAVGECEGMVFDAVLVLRATDSHWPPAERSHPLLAWPLQRGLRMPGADPALAAQRARAFMDGLLRRAPYVRFSCAAANADGPLRPSPLLSELALTPAALPALDAAGAQPVALDRVLDEAPLPPLPGAAVHGGANVLKLQAACGFRAFAQLRLHSAEPGEPSFGLDAAESGSLLHTVMQRVWQRIPTQEELALFSAEERSGLLAFCIEEALQRESPRPLTPWDTAYRELLRERLHRLLLPWLEVELERAPFAIDAVESQAKVRVGPLTLSVRVDRIDRVAGGKVLIDYKTGVGARPAQWMGARPDEPQLPLYSLLLEPEELKGIAFARLRAGKEMKYAGLQAEEGILPGRQRPAALAAEQEHWRGVLDDLAQAFADGRAEVDPKEYPGTCRHCDQRMLCRLDPGSRVAPADEEIADGSADQ